MSSTWSRAFVNRRLRWALPAGVAAAIAAASLTSTAASSSAAEPTLPARTAAQLLADLEQAHTDGLSGTIVETAKLGLPQLPDIGGAGDSSDLSLSNLVTGAHTMRVWYAGQQNQRLALLGQLSETDVIRHGTDLWSYSSTTRKVTHTTLQKADEPLPQPGGTGGVVGALTPQQAADKALAAIDPTTAVEVDRTARVAGRAAYQLLVTPKDSRSLIGSVRIALDSKTSVPLRVQVFARGANSPAIQVGFTDVSFNVPDASVFQFVPPAGSTVVQGNPWSSNENPNAKVMPPRIKGTAPNGSAPGTAPVPGTAPGTASAKAGSPTVLGKGWTAVAVVKEPAGATNNPQPSMFDILNKISTPASGGHLITSALVSIFITADGTIYAGPVSATAIQQVATSGHGL
ncbi:MAG: LolA family protein [Acidothermaceae bacterium]